MHCCALSTQYGGSSWQQYARLPVHWPPVPTHPPVVLHAYVPHCMIGFPQLVPDGRTGHAIDSVRAVAAHDPEPQA